MAVKTKRSPKYRRFTLQGELRRMRRGMKDSHDREMMTWAINAVDAWYADNAAKQHPAVIELERLFRL